MMCMCLLCPRPPASQRSGFTNYVGASSRTLASSRFRSSRSTSLHEQISALRMGTGACCPGDRPCVCAHPSGWAFFCLSLSAMTKVDLWMPIYIGDYLSATSRLTTEQHGAYLLLIMDYWKNGPLPDDHSVLAQITRMSNDAWSNASSIVLAFFKHEGKHYHHKRIDAELALAATKKERRVARAKSGAAKRWGNDASSNASSNQQAMLNQCPSPSPCIPNGIHISRPKKIASSDDVAAKENRARVWSRYATAYALRYETNPVRNAKTNTAIAQLISRIGKDAEDVAEWFVSHPDNFYVKNLHDVSLLLKDCEKLRTQWATGRTITNQSPNGYKSQKQINDEATTRAIFGHLTQPMQIEKTITGEVL